MFADFDVFYNPRATINQTVGCGRVGIMIDLLSSARISPALKFRSRMTVAPSFSSSVSRAGHVYFSSRQSASLPLSSAWKMCDSQFSCNNTSMSHKVLFHWHIARFTCARRLALMRSASSLCVQRVVNHASFAEGAGTLLVSVLTVLELT